MNSVNVSVIAAATPRSLEYIKGLQRVDIEFNQVYLLDDGGYRPGQREVDKAGEMARRIEDFCCGHNIEINTYPADVNSKELEAALSNDNSRLTIFSGYGGQIVKPSILDVVNCLLHIHSGVLPEYRGSTTIYYAILNDDPCGATAILLDKNIDTGAIVGEKQYPAPRPGADIDFNLDIVFRTDLLIEVVLEYQRNGYFKTQVAQSMDEGKLYYVAHPLLRHIAMLRGVEKPEFK